MIDSSLYSSRMLCKCHIINFVVLVLFCSLVLGSFGEIEYELQTIRTSRERFNSDTMGLDETKFDQMEIKHQGNKVTCYIPKIVEREMHDSKEPQGETDIEKLLKLLHNSCLFKVEGWWSYEFCFGRHIRQYHEDERGKLSNEYYLGYPKDDKILEEEEYASLNYEGGSTCDLTGLPRKTEVRLKCNSEISIIGDIKEVSTCNYILNVELPSLCSHSKYKPKKVQRESILCFDFSKEAVLEPSVPKFVPQQNIGATLRNIYPYENGHCSDGAGASHHFEPADRLEVRYTRKPGGRWKALVKVRK
eukprot:TRINITY_DN2739_c0_g1_i2.p1 TRINITY_DN2739_c0_g1~~TRINITY_DN2739_c0_g1_i2.p1  ORF type:complete len:304 (-),score=27.95 TRINITY_DN2739_c0_g1_i2:411-1322(-)